MTARVRRLVLVAASLWLAPVAVHAHAVHTAAVEMEHNHETGRVEVSLRLFLDDLEAALSARAGHPIRADRGSATEFATLATDYIAANLVVVDATGNSVRPEWIGREIKDAANEAWLFVQFRAPATLEGTRLRVTLLRELFADQLTSVLLRDGKRSLSLLFPPGETERQIRWPR